MDIIDEDLFGLVTVPLSRLRCEVAMGGVLSVADNEAASPNAAVAFKLDFEVDVLTDIFEAASAATSLRVAMT